MQREVAPRVDALALAAEHRFTKRPCAHLMLLAGLGVEGDAHCGATVKHRSRVKADPTQPNLRQVHLVPAERLDELNAQGFALAPGDIGENILTRGIDLFALPRGAQLALGAAVIEVTGLRNPCHQLDDFRPGLMAACLGRDDRGKATLRAGIMGIVTLGGMVRVGDVIGVSVPDEPFVPLRRV